MGEPGPSLRTTLIVYVLLMLLAALTTGLAFLDLGPWSLPAAMTVAGVKALLVALYFMHLRYAPRLTAVLAASGLVMVIILFALTLSDVLARSWRSPFVGGAP